jgi:hypothetical protein
MSHPPGKWLFKQGHENTIDLMTPDETTFFQLLDAYARTRHRCFLAEMTLWTEELGYNLCFRPLDVFENSPARYACMYLKVSTEQVKTAGSGPQLPTFLADRLDAELSELKAPDDSVREG